MDILYTWNSSLYRSIMEKKVNYDLSSVLEKKIYYKSGEEDLLQIWRRFEDLKKKKKKKTREWKKKKDLGRGRRRKRRMI